MGRWKRRTVRKLAREHWAEGFYAGLLNGWPDTPLTYSQAPAWWDAVASAAHRAGYAKGDRLRGDVVQSDGYKRPPLRALAADVEARRQPHEPSADDMAHFMRVAEEASDGR